MADAVHISLAAEAMHQLLRTEDGDARFEARLAVSSSGMRTALSEVDIVSL